MRIAFAPPLVLALSLAACSPSYTPSPLVVARPYDVNVPPSYNGSKATPLVVLLHGYSATPYLEDAVFGMSDYSNTAGFLLALPSGLKDHTGAPFWNATDACCNFDNVAVDDVTYLTAVIDDLRARYHVDDKRIFVVGHSNGGFMSHRMACDRSTKIAGIVSLAGAQWLDQSHCKPTDPVAVLEVHGDADTEVPYNGGPDIPSATQTVLDWAALDGCNSTLTPYGTIDLDSRLMGAETTQAAVSCTGAHAAAELWTIHGGSHVPNFNLPAWPQAIFTWLMAHPRP